MNIVCPEGLKIYEYSFRATIETLCGTKGLTELFFFHKAKIDVSKVLATAVVHETGLLLFNSMFILALLHPERLLSYVQKPKQHGYEHNLRKLVNHQF